jgi:ADP-dependent phosphofructokinase/glucokinase
MYVKFCSENLKAREELIRRVFKSICSALDGDVELLSSSSLEQVCTVQMKYCMCILQSRHNRRHRTTEANYYYLPENK